MNMTKLNSQLTGQVAMSREADGYAINWSPCGFNKSHGKKAFEGWDG